MSEKMSELEKHAKIAEEQAMLEEFLDWLHSKGWTICEIPKKLEHTWFPITLNQQQLLNIYFEIDPVLLDKERRELLASTNKFVE